MHVCIGHKAVFGGERTFPWKRINRGSATDRSFPDSQTAVADHNCIYMNACNPSDQVRNFKLAKPGERDPGEVGRRGAGLSQVGPRRKGERRWSRRAGIMSAACLENVSPAG